MTTTLITGSNKGLGCEAARQLVAAGHGQDGPTGEYFDLTSAKLVRTSAGAVGERLCHASGLSGARAQAR